MTNTINEMPTGECPKCGHCWQLDDYWTLGVDDEIECPACECVIVITCRDTTITLDFEVKGGAT